MNKEPCDLCGSPNSLLIYKETIGDEGPQSRPARRCRPCIDKNKHDIIDWWTLEEEAKHDAPST
jgi:hypothetical protein